MKKKRIVKLEPQTVELFAEVLSKLRPPPPLTVSQWADRYRVLSAESSAEPGRWHTEKAPYQRAIMDAIGDPHVRSVVVMSAAQIGKTDAFILNPLGYYMDYAPCPVMCMQPTLDMGQTLSKDRIAPMIRDTPRLTGLVDTKSRYAGNTVMKKNFPGGHITIVGANSPSSLASRPIKVLLADEIDRYPKSAGTEGDPLDLAKKRQTTFWDYKTVMVSTPTIKGDAKVGDVIYAGSAMAAAATVATDANNGDIPNVSPDNKPISISAACLKDGTEVLLDQEQANVVNSFGVATWLNMNGFRLWGNNTACYPGNTDPKDRWFSVRRFFCWDDNTFIQTYFQKVSDPLNKRLIEALVDSENVRGNSFVSRGICARYELQYIESENPTTDLLNGTVKFHKYMSPFNPAEDIEEIVEFDPNAISTALAG